MFEVQLQDYMGRSSQDFNRSSLEEYTSNSIGLLIMI